MSRVVFVPLTILCLLSLSSITGLIQLVKAEGTPIYINADGSISPSTAPMYTADNITYTLTGNINANADGIVIDRDNIILDGAGYMLQGTGSGMGIDLSGTVNVTVKNTQVSVFYVGVFLNSSSNSNVSGNNVTNNVIIGVWLLDSSNSSILENIFINGGMVVTGSFGNVVSGNLVNGKPLVYLEGASGDIVNDAGQVIAVDSSGIQIQNLDLSNATVGVELWASNNCTVSQNNVSNNHYDGLALANCSHNSISGNNITNNVEGFELGDSSNNTISGNNIVANNGEGLFLLVNSSNNVICHNNLYGNSSQVFSRAGSVNTWDDDYPSGGNYWSDYNGTDFYCGAYQNQTGSDGIGDTPYVIDANNLDNYPLMTPYVPFANQTIYINVDGSVDPSGAPILRNGDLYTLTGNITSDDDGIVVERDSIVVDGQGYTVQGTGSGTGITLSGRGNVTIKNTEITTFDFGILAYSASHNDSITGNNITNSGAGIYLVSSSGNTISANSVTNNEDGIYLASSSNNNTISDNNVTANNYAGIYLVSSSSHNTVSGNSVTDNVNGIFLVSSSGNTVSANSLTDNRDGIVLLSSSNNTVYLNNFVNNTIQTDFFGVSVNVWDDGSRGNYWSDYPTKYPNATQVDSSGVWNTPYVIDTNNTDHYPLMVQYEIPEFPSFLILPLFFMATLLAVMVYKKKANPYKSARATGSKRLIEQSSS